MTNWGEVWDEIMKAIIGQKRQQKETINVWDISQHLILKYASQKRSHIPKPTVNWSYSPV